MDIKHIHFETIDSTNTWAKLHPEKLGKHHLTVISTNYQTAGRGRFKRSWIAPAGTSILTTFSFFQSDKDIKNIPQILALSALELLSETGLKVQIKWPNDLNVGEKKIGGILAETSIEKSGIWCFLGIGLNINIAAEDLAAIDRPATSLLLETKREHSVPYLTQRLAVLFRSHLETYKKKGFAPFYPFLQNELMHKIGDLIKINGCEGIFSRINPDGSLVLQKGEEELIFISGEII